MQELKKIMLSLGYAYMKNIGTLSRGNQSSSLYKKSFYIYKGKKLAPPLDAMFFKGSSSNNLSNLGRWSSKEHLFQTIFNSAQCSSFGARLFF